MRKRVLLVYMPFGGVERPALGISLLKAAAESIGFPCDIAYFNIVFAEMIGWPAYAGLSNTVLPTDEGVYPYTTLAGEWLFSQYFYGPGSLDAAAYANDLLRTPPYCLPDREIHDLLALRARVRPFLYRCLSAVDWQRYGLVGFSSTFTQNLASLCLAQEVKRLFPDMRIIFGGANWEAGMGEELFRQFPFVDYASLGEADHSFPELMRVLDAGAEPSAVKGIAWRTAAGTPVINEPPVMVRDLDALPLPDFSDYFSQFRRSPLASFIRAWLQLETSRGCWWGQKNHCTFCGLNGTTMAFRRKSPERALQETLSLSRKWRVRKIAFADNILDLGYLKSVLPVLAKQRPRLHIFYETKSNLRKEHVRLLAAAGVREIQPGIESLSSAVLRIMRKGVSALHNIAFLKWCHQFGVRAYWNILYGFPGEDPADYRRMLELMRRIVHLPPPLSMGPIRLDRFSPNYVNADRSGFARVRPLASYAFIYPFEEQALSRLCYFFDYDHADGRLPERYADSAARFWCCWRDAAARGAVGTLDYQPHDDGSAVLLDHRFNRRVERLVLSPRQRAVYEYCDEPRPFAAICSFLDAHFPERRPRRRTLRRFLTYLHRAYFTARENDTYLSVAVMDPSLPSSGNSAAQANGDKRRLPLPVGPAATAPV
jgi:ribosomal peptide maturation radical SAM protein 1